MVKGGYLSHKILVLNEQIYTKCLFPEYLLHIIRAQC